MTMPDNGKEPVEYVPTVVSSGVDAHPVYFHYLRECGSNENINGSSC